MKSIKNIKSALTLLTAFVLFVLFSFTFSSCKGCNKGKNGTQTSPPHLKPVIEPMTPQEQELDALLEKALVEVRDMLTKAKAEEANAEAAERYSMAAGPRNKVNEILKKVLEVANDAKNKMVGVEERVSLKAKFQEVAKVVMEVAETLGKINKLLQTKQGQTLLNTAWDAEAEAEAWATATEWAVLGGETDKAKLFAGHAMQAAKTAAQLAKNVMGPMVRDAERAARMAQAAADRAANSLKDIH
jgi:hypothetical protein